MDTQDKEPEIKVGIDRVGVEGIRSHLKILRGNMEFSHLPLIDVMIDLPDDKRGVHMSRLIETINEIISKKTEGIKESLEEFGLEVLDEILKKHSYRRGDITIKTILVIPRTTPVSAKITNEPYDVEVRVVKNGKKSLKSLKVKAIGNTLCPHSLEITNGLAHMQRAEVELEILTDMKTDISLEELIGMAEGSFSSPTFTVLKSEDEKFVVERMYSNPKFVEDLTRECFDKVRALGIEGKVKIKAISYESIHKHNAVSEIERKIKGSI